MQVEGRDAAGLVSTEEGEPEPADDAAGAMEIAVRLPDGRLQRRFLCTDPVMAVEAWLRRQGQDMQRHVLSRQWPRKVRLLFRASGLVWPARCQTGACVAAMAMGCGCCTCANVST